MDNKKTYNSKKSAFRSAFSQQHSPKLTKVQSEVLYLLTKEFLTIKQISIRRKTKIRTIQQTVKKLKDLGIINNAFKEVRFSSPTNAQSLNKNLIRLHGEEFNLNIIFKDDRYKEVLGRTNFIDFDGNTVRLSRDSIEVYSGKSFYGDSVSKATSRSIEYWNLFFNKLGNYLNIILIKSNVQNIRRVNAHYSEIENELAKDYEVRGERIRIYTREDGKLWFLMDNSFNLHEVESVHPSSSKEDMELVKSCFNDIRSGEWERMKYGLDIILKVQGDYAEQIKKHLLVQDETLKTLKSIQEAMNRDK